MFLDTNPGRTEIIYWAEAKIVFPWTGGVHLFLHDDHGKPGLRDLARPFFSRGAA